VRVLKAKQVIEIGADRGVSSMMMASEGARVYSVDIRNGWEYVKSKKVVKLVGDSCDKSLFKDVDLKQTKLWLIDGLHTYDKVKQELATYQEYMKTGDIVLMDDVYQYIDVWSLVTRDRMISTDIHADGVGIVAI
jgi:predicted O-methyltransferase YrrM